MTSYSTLLGSSQKHGREDEEDLAVGEPQALVLVLVLVLVLPPPVFVRAPNRKLLAKHSEASSAPPGLAQGPLRLEPCATRTPWKENPGSR